MGTIITKPGGGGTQVGYRGFKYNVKSQVMAPGASVPPFPVPANGEAIYTFQYDEDGDFFRGISISVVDANGVNITNIVNKINNNPVTIIYPNGTYTIIPGTASFGDFTVYSTHVTLFTTGGWFGAYPVPENNSYIDFNIGNPPLVSGTNIKTINSASLLGSGDVAVQPTLVSGTNIKTINGTTLLGSGDLVVGGPGSGSAHMVYGTTGLQYSNTINASSMTFGSLVTVSGAIGLTPFTPRITFTTNNFSVLVTAAGAAIGGGIAIYRLVGSQAGSSITVTKYQQYTLNLTAGTTGIYTVSASFQFQAGVTYWIGYCSNITTGGPYTLATYDPRVMLPISSPVGALQYIGHYLTGIGTSSTFPDTLTLSSGTISNTITQVWFTVGAIS